MVLRILDGHTQHCWYFYILSGKEIKVKSACVWHVENHVPSVAPVFRKWIPFPLFSCFVYADLPLHSAKKESLAAIFILFYGSHTKNYATWSAARAAECSPVVPLKLMLDGVFVSND